MGSGQVRVFNRDVQRKLSRAQVLAFTGSSVRDRNKKGEGVRGGGGLPALAGTREYYNGVMCFVFIEKKNRVYYRNKQGLKRMLFNRTRQCNIQIFDRNSFVK